MFQLPVCVFFVFVFVLANHPSCIVSTSTCRLPTCTCVQAACFSLHLYSITSDMWNDKVAEMQLPIICICICICIVIRLTCSQNVIANSSSVSPPPAHLEENRTACRSICLNMLNCIVHTMHTMQCKRLRCYRIYINTENMYGNANLNIRFFAAEPFSTGGCLFDCLIKWPAFMLLHTAQTQKFLHLCLHTHRKYVRYCI